MEIKKHILEERTKCSIIIYCVDRIIKDINYRITFNSIKHLLENKTNNKKCINKFLNVIEKAIDCIIINDINKGDKHVLKHIDLVKQYITAEQISKLKEHCILPMSNYTSDEVLKNTTQANETLDSLQTNVNRQK